jgi:hypothetical protein
VAWKGRWSLFLHFKKRRDAASTKRERVRWLPRQYNESIERRSWVRCGFARWRIRLDSEQRLAAETVDLIAPAISLVAAVIAVTIAVNTPAIPLYVALYS